MPKRKSAVDLDQLDVAFARMGERAAHFFKLMSAGAPRIWGHQARQILQLRERFDTADIVAALDHAADFGALEFVAVERIVVARAKPRSLDEYIAAEAVHKLETTLGHSLTRPRDLTDYDRIPGRQPEDLCRENHDPPHLSTPPLPPPVPPLSSEFDDTSRSSD